VGLALFGAFITRAELTTDQISLLSPLIFACLIFGAMIPYWFSAMTMKSVGKAANEMVKEVARQFREIPGLLEVGLCTSRIQL
jgi:Na+/H+-translocating membrane pyrophosphatase